MAIMTHWVHCSCKNITATGHFERVLMQTQTFPGLDSLSTYVTGAVCGKTSTVASPGGPSNRTCLRQCNEIQKTQSFVTFQKRTRQRSFFFKSLAQRPCSHFSETHSLRHTEHPSQKTWSHMFNVNSRMSLNLSMHNCVIHESYAHRLGLTDAPITIQTLRSNRDWTL